MREMERAQEYLSRSDPAHPLVAPLRGALERIEPLPWLGLPAWRRARSRVGVAYRRLASAPGFDAAVIAFFVGQLLLKLAYGAMLIFVVGLGWRQVLDIRFVGRVAERMVELSSLEVAQLAASGLARWFVLMGVVRIGVSRVRAYRMFERAIVTSILLVQVFSFYSEQFAALVELIFNLTILAFVRAAIAAEEAREALGLAGVALLCYLGHLFTFCILALLLVVAALLLDLGEAANVLSRLHTDPSGGALYTAVVAGVAPNAALLGGAYLLGPGFAVGTGTVVSTSAVAIGPLPAFPLVAALPDAGATPGWASWLPVLPALLGVCGGALLVRRHRPERVEVAALEGLVAGLLAAAVVAALVGLAGGAVGPGRMSEVGAPVLDTWWAAVLALTPGCLVGAAGAAALGRWLPWRS